MTVKLRDVVDMMDMQNAQMTAYLNRQSGEVVLVSEDSLAAAEDGFAPEDYADWEVEELTIAQQVLEGEPYLRLPDSFDIDEFGIMERFCHSLPQEQANSILAVLGGRGSFQRFKQAIHQHDVTEGWYSFKQSALEQVAADWLEENGISYDKPVIGCAD
ncbi:MAG: UPF0158 family protein [Phormidesmis sp.]